MEAVAFQVCEIMRAMQLDSQIDLRKLMVDGGMTKNNLLMQIQADLLGIYNFNTFCYKVILFEFRDSC